MLWLFRSGRFCFRALVLERIESRGEIRLAFSFLAVKSVGWAKS